MPQSECRAQASKWPFLIVDGSETDAGPNLRRLWSGTNARAKKTEAKFEKKQNV
jgi:hypothetical protein